MELKDFMLQNGKNLFRDFTHEEIAEIQHLTSQLEQVKAILKLIHDPEMSINIYDLGLIYNIDIDGDKITITMTLTSATCPVADYILQEIKDKVLTHIKSAHKVDINLVWTPKWHKDMMSEEAKFMVGM